MINKKFARRLRIYMIGVFLGVLMVFALFKERTAILTSWLPGNAVQKAIQTSEWKLQASDTCLMQCLNLTEEEFKGMVKDAKVLFSESREKENSAGLRSYYLRNRDYKIASFLTTFENDSLVSFGKWKLEESLSCDCL